MRAFSRPGGKIRITIPEEIDTEWQRDPVQMSIIVDRDEYNELRDQILEGDPVRAELESALADALSQIEQLHSDRDHWQQEAENHAQAVELWKSLAERQDNTAPLRRELSAVKRELDRRQREAERLKREADELKEERDALRHLQHVAPARMVIHTTAAEKRDWESGDMATADVLDRIAATAPVGSLVDDLKNTIVSQAREIARLKGESE